MVDEGYDIAQICLNGHVINKEVNEFPQHNQEFCDKCGEKTITKCEKCNANIRGEYYVPGVMAIGFNFPAPKFCYKCGSPYPWTERGLVAAKELAEEIDNLTKEEKEILKKSLDELTKDSPNTQVAALRFKRIMSKVGKSVGDPLKEILINIVSEAGKKALGI